MKYAKLATLLALPVAFAVTLGAAPQPADAGKACNRLNLNSPCIRSGDVKPNLKLGKTGNDGDLIVRDASKVNNIQLDGDTGNITNRFSNAAGESNGLVKAWAQIAADGTIIDCWRCNTDTSETMKTIFTGIYHVDFTPLATDISGRPYSGLINVPNGLVEVGQISVINLSGSDPSTVLVRTEDASGTLADKVFTVIVY